MTDKTVIQFIDYENFIKDSFSYRVTVWYETTWFEVIELYFFQRMMSDYVYCEMTKYVLPQIIYSFSTMNQRITFREFVIRVKIFL